MNRQEWLTFLVGVLVVAGAGAGAWWFMSWAESGYEDHTKAYLERRDAAPDAVACRAAHGFPVYSKWDGQMIDCKPLPRITEAP